MNTNDNDNNGKNDTKITTSDLFFNVQQKTDKEHILSNPDTYIGSIENIESDMWVLHENEKIAVQTIQYIPGLFNLFNEGIVNCRDHVIRMKTKVDNKTENALPVTHIDISIHTDGTITMINDGNGIDVAKHPEYQTWIPELIFGHLRTSTNYDKTEKKIVGGKNGFGFKLVLIWSTYGFVETVDHVRGLKYQQEFKNNLDVICPPTITKCKLKPYTKIVFKPDYARFGLSGLSTDMITLLKKRVYDISAITDKNIKVKCNDKIVPIKNFQQYIDMYIGNKTTCDRVYEENGERWEYAVALTPSNEFIQVSFVNGIQTNKGGKHVDYIVYQITKKLAEFIEKKKKIKVNINSIKEQLILFLRCDIENPSFDSQTKDCMNTPPSKFGSKCDVTDKFIEKVAKLGVMDAACAITEIKENKAAKKSDGTKTKNIRGIPKLIDANFAGTDKSKECIIIFCEGDSAKAGIISGLSSDDRNYIGVYPMKGKILNVRGENIKKIAENKEITEIKKIVGLEMGKKYNTIEDVNRNLRYGKIIFMTDQDLDGSHIKGLGINLFQSEWSSLLSIPDFIGFINTPILKAKKGNNELNFYNDGEYNIWKENNDSKGWTIKYYKGLGTSTGKEFQDYFREKKIVTFHKTDNTNDMIDMVFNSKRADDRKNWLRLYDRNAYLDTSKSNVSYEEFLNRELIHFSKYDCDRSIPNLMDGLKISLRKILFSAFKRNLTSEIKVSQFSGYVSEHSGYHHGEASLNAAIIGMAQNYVGSNNINLLMPNGQYGTRINGGKDSASERYIFTQLNKITRIIFPEEDDNVLKYLNDDGVLVEPIYYAPIIPMILVNGTKGIGTGFSTDVMCYNPLEIIEYLINKLTNSSYQSQQTFLPFYEGFKGTVVEITPGKYMIKGLYTKIDEDKIRVTELPVGFWTHDFKEHLEDLIDTGKESKESKEKQEKQEKKEKKEKKTIQIIKDYDDLSKDTNVDFIITFSKGKLEELEKCKLENGVNALEKTLKLFTTNTTTNMHLFDHKDKLCKFDKITDIIDCYFNVRLELFQERKDYIINKLEKECVLLSNKTRYIMENLNGTIDLRRKKKEEVIHLLVSKKYDIMNEDDEFKYLVKMPMDVVTQENVDKIIKEKEQKESELFETRNTSKHEMWLKELDKLRNLYISYKQERTLIMNGEKDTEKMKIKAKKIVKQKKT
jgi:DNA topoisomerase-2